MCLGLIRMDGVGRGVGGGDGDHRVRRPGPTRALQPKNENTYICIFAVVMIFQPNPRPTRPTTKKRKHIHMYAKM